MNVSLSNLILNALHLFFSDKQSTTKSYLYLSSSTIMTLQFHINTPSPSLVNSSLLTALPPCLILLALYRKSLNLAHEMKIRLKIT